MRRLYIGGLSHTVTQKDLKDRFGKFGDVEDVELRTRRDEDGVPYKTFSYININISDADLKKCLTVLNKSKWKGGTLQIETAKESFLHRLAQEREVAAEQQRQPAAEDKTQKILDSFSKAGVDNFTMKAAVPGTEIPGHKDWVVSKFGRVLPVLQLRCQKGNKARTMKYDPSKYSHNICKLDRHATDQSTPVTQLTWEVQGGDDDISKKRRGEFPPFEPSKPKKSRTDAVNSHNAAGRTSFPLRSEQNVTSVSHTETHQFTNGFELQTSRRPAQRNWAHYNDSDVDSDEEIRRLVAAQQTSHVSLRQGAEEDNLEVVGHDYLKESRHKDEEDYDSADTDEIFAARKPPPPQPQEKPAPQTAEHLSGNNTDRKKKTNKKRKAVEEQEEDEDTDAEEQLVSRKPSTTQQKGDSNKQTQSKKTAIPPVVKASSSESSSDEGDDDDEEFESAGSCSDSDYEAMFSNVTHLEISLADLQKLAEEAEQTSEATAPSILGSGREQEAKPGPAERPAPKKGTMPEDILAAIMADDSSEDEGKKKKKKRKGVMATPLPAFQGTKALHEEEEDGGKSEVKKQKLNSEGPQLNHKATDGKRVNGLKLTQTEIDTSESSDEEDEDEEDSEDEEESEEEEEEEKEGQTVNSLSTPKVSKVVPVNSEEAETGSSSSSDDDDDEEEEEEEQEEQEEGTKTSQTVHTTKSTAKASPSSCSSSEEDDSEEEANSSEKAVEDTPQPALDSESSSSEEEEEKELQAPRKVVLGAAEEEELQRKANMRRLAAVQQRQKEAEEHKKLIKGALANLDAPAAGAGKRIIFGSDDEDDDEDKQQTVSGLVTSKKTLIQDSQSEDEDTSDEEAASTEEKVHLKPSGPQLFGGSEDEEEDGDEEEEDGSRFDIRPEFEGPAGQKLMALQSRFGTDERFRMDSRFLEEDKDNEKETEVKGGAAEEDEALEEEKKKTLSILQSVLGSSQQTCSSKTPVKAKKFRDVSALHYDPSKEEHAVFETKTDETKKESKSTRRKKREEAQKLPEVSKDIYYDVSGDLKAVFGQTKNGIDGGGEQMNWDQVEEEEAKEKEEEKVPLTSHLATDPSTEQEDSSGFKFSFFGDNTETGSGETAEYKVESIQAPKVSWQQDPRFHDSSSEEEDDDQEKDEEDGEQGTATTETTEEATASKTDLFFFFPDDNRLTEGPRLFCRMSQLEEQREEWEERRSALRQEYRKKHKYARRSLTSSMKS